MQHPKLAIIGIKKTVDTFTHINGVAPTAHIARKLETIVRHKGGNCGELAALAAAFLQNRPVSIAMVDAVKRIDAAMREILHSSRRLDDTARQRL